MASLAQTAPLATKQSDFIPADTDLKNDLQLTHWMRLDQENPALSEFALGKPLVDGDKPLWNIDPNNPVLDSDPYFLRTQKWVDLTFEQKHDLSHCKTICTLKNSNNDLILASAQDQQGLILQQKFSAVLETQEWIFFAADTNDIFKAKVGAKDAGQGLFFINKVDYRNFSVKAQPVPVFHLPLVGKGWLSSEIKAQEIPVYGTLALKAADGFILNVDKSDVLEMEQLSRKNFTLLQVVTFVTRGLDEAGMALPEPKSTMAFGLIATTITPKTYSQFNPLKSDTLKSIVSALGIQKAHATDDQKPTTLRDQIFSSAEARAQQLDEEFNSSPPEEKKSKSALRRWLTPSIFYGTTGVLAYGAAQQVDWTKLITADMPQRILTVASIFGVVAVASLSMRYTIHRDFFDKKYPKSESVTLLQKLNREHKAFMDEFVYGLRFSAGATVQGVLRSIDYLKDRFFSSNKIVDDAWSSTLGFYIQASSKLPIDYRCFYLGAIVFGMSDALMVAVDMLIFTPYLIKTFAISSMDHAAVAAFASATVLSNFLSYLQTGALSYSMDIRTINLDRAKKEAKRILTAQKIDVEDPKNQHKVRQLQEEILSEISKSVGLPGKESFLYDPITVMQKLIQTSGYSAHTLTEEQKTKIKDFNFVLQDRHWGLVKPALKNAIANAEEINRKSPSEIGEKTIQLLKWALDNKDFSNIDTLAGVSKKLIQGVPQQSDDLLEINSEALLQESIKNQATEAKPLNWWKAIYAGIKSTLKYAVSSEAKKVRDIRMVLYLMSTTDSWSDVVEFLPSSWNKQAGSTEVAQAAAELFHRDFMSLFEKKKHLSNPDTKMTEDYTARAEKLINEMQQTDSSLKNSFVRQLRLRSLIGKLYEQDQSKINLLTFEPEKLSRVEKNQWDFAFAEVEKNWNTNTDSLVSSAWNKSADIYKSRFKSEDPDFQTKNWILENEKKLMTATAMAKQLGLWVSDINDSQLIQDVVIKTASQTEGELSSPENQEYLKKATPQEKDLYEARVFYEHFVANYFAQTTMNDKFDAYSKEFPGRFQNIRSSMSDKTWGRPIVSILKAFEIMFRADPAAYSPGLSSKINRAVPLLPDFYHNFVRGARSFPFSLTVGYLMSYYIWQIHIPYPLLVFGLAFSFLHPSMVEMNNRVMRNYNIKPMDDVPSKLTYSFIHSRLTNPQVMFEMIYAGTIVSLLTVQNLSLGAAAAAGFFAGKYTYNKSKERRKQREKEEKVIREEDGDIHLRPQRCVELFTLHK